MPEILQHFERPEFYPHPVSGLRHIQTHISHIFLTGRFAYKIKKAVDFGFLDFSSLAARQKFCLKELELNRRLAPSIYLKVMAVIKKGPGLALVPLDQTAGQKALEYCLQMTQMDTGREMDALLGKGRVTPAQVRELARILCRFYQKADRGPAIDFYGRPEQIRINLEENFRQTEDYQEVSVAPARWRFIRQYALDFLANNRGLFTQRVREGRVVDGHGDLHSGNINLPEAGEPLVFDCIEFNERFRYQDAACDLAFLAMDLDFHGRSDLSDILVHEFVGCGEDQGLWQVLDFYKCYRAVVRAKIFGFAFDDQDVPGGEKFTDIKKARRYFRLAAGYAGVEPPFFLVCIMGLMGTGKSYLARRLAAQTGWVTLHSDQVRKQRAGLAPTQAKYDDWGQGLYGPGATEDTYRALREGTEARLAQGAGVIVDASFSKEKWRRAFLDLAEKYGARPLFVEVAATEQVVKKRLAAREAKGGSVSDGRLEIMQQQAAAWEDAGDLASRLGIRLDGGAPGDEKLGTVMARLEKMGYDG